MSSLGCGASSTALHRQRSIMGSAGSLRVPCTPPGTAARRQRRWRLGARVAWDRQEPPKELSKDPEAKFRQ